MTPLAFCLVSTFYPPYSFGGDAVHVHRLATGLASRGHRVRVVHSPGAYRILAGDSQPALGYPDHPDVEVVPVRTGPASTTATYLTGLPLGYRRELGELVDDGFDVIHFHNPSLAGGPGAMALGSALKLYTAHEHWLLCPTHVLFRYGREVCEHRTCWRCTLSYHRPPQVWRSFHLMERSLAHIDLLTCPSVFTAQLHRDFFPEVAIEVLPSFFSPEPAELAAAPASAPRDRPYFLYVGRLETIKGADRLVHAFESVTGADLLIVGDGTQEQSLRQMAAANTRVVWCGRLPRAEVMALYRGALAVVVPSVGYETFAGVAVEAMALGTPVLVRDLGPLPELVSDGGGWVFADDDELARRLQDLADHPERAEAEGDVASRVAAARWDISLLFGRYFDLIAGAAARTGRADLAAKARLAAGRENEKLAPGPE